MTHDRDGLDSPEFTISRITDFPIIRLPDSPIAKSLFDTDALGQANYVLLRGSLFSGALPGFEAKKGWR
jgi:hypothetical protein